MINQIKQNIYQITFKEFGSCVYLIKSKNNILIDTSSKQNREELIKELKKLNITPKEIDTVLLTHAHFDHIENIELFQNAKIYGSLKDFNCEGIISLKKLNLKYIKVIQTPGHTKGSVCFLDKNNKILFSGDTLFNNGYIGRTDFPNSSKKQMEKSLEKLKKINYRILCPGHLIY